MNSKIIGGNDKKILYVSFNQDSSCFSVGTETGFKIYNTNPYKPNFERSNYYINLTINIRSWRGDRNSRNAL